MALQHRTGRQGQQQQPISLLVLLPCLLAYFATLAAFPYHVTAFLTMGGADADDRATAGLTLEDPTSKLDRRSLRRINPCAAVLCAPPTVCEVTDNKSKAVCVCPPGYVPGKKGQPACVPDRCATVRCATNRTCVNVNGQAKCVCRRGLQCPVPSASACAAVQCPFPSTCRENKNGRPVCACPAGYYRNAAGRCTLDKCAAVRCATNRTCRLRSGQPKCECRRGLQCSDVDFNPCAATTCPYPSNCTVKRGKAVCECPNGYIRRRGLCVEDPCSSLICAAIYVCNSSSGVAKCVCPDSTRGNGCTDPEDPPTTNPCAATTCPYPSTCTVKRGKAVCECPTGYIKRKGVCIEDPCSTVMCAAIYVCDGSSGVAKCVCPRGRSGPYCNDTKDPPVTDPCAAVRCAAPTKCVVKGGIPACV